MTHWHNRADQPPEQAPGPIGECCKDFDTWRKVDWGLTPEEEERLRAEVIEERGREWWG